jgi:adenylate kinase family enzyme
MRIAIIGTSGAGKSTLARRLGAAIDAPVIELDAINWQADWVDLNSHAPDEFIRRVEAAVAAERWVSDGNYSLVRPLIMARATHLIWLDYSRAVVMSRVLRRSFARAWTGRELWPGTGNREAWRRWLDKDHPIRWAWDTFDSRRARYAAMFDDPALAGVTRYRLRRPGEADGVAMALKA